jgi:NADH-quinone oxidoreductase subunit F
MSKILKRILAGNGRRADVDELARISQNIMNGRSLCAFGEAASWPIESYVLKFRDEFLALCAAAEDSRKEIWGEAGINRFA